MLDYLVTCYIYTNSDADPGRLTDIRSAWFATTHFCCLLVDLGLRGNICTQPQKSGKKIVDFDSRKYEDIAAATTAASRNYSRSISTTAQCSLVNNLKLINESRTPEAKEIEVPKLLGRLEALVGAVLDSGHDLEKVWNVFLRSKPFATLKSSLKCPPMNPKKLLFEACDSVEFGSADVRNKDVKVSVHQQEQQGVQVCWAGNNKRMLRLMASKQALNFLASETIEKCEEAEKYQEY